MDENRMLCTLRNLSTDLAHLRQVLLTAGRHGEAIAAIAERVIRDADVVADLIRDGSE
jgi:hypothetical protein